MLKCQIINCHVLGIRTSSFVSMQISKISIVLLIKLLVNNNHSKFKVEKILLKATSLLRFKIFKNTVKKPMKETVWGITTG